MSVGKVTLTANLVKAIFTAVTAFVSSVTSALANVASAIAASPPIITTVAQIDAASWPANS